MAVVQWVRVFLFESQHQRGTWPPHTLHDQNIRLDQYHSSSKFVEVDLYLVQS